MPRPPLLPSLVLATLALAGCADDGSTASASGSGSGTGSLAVSGSGAAAGPRPNADPVSLVLAEGRCRPVRDRLAAGVTTFAIEHRGERTTEVYVYEGDKVVTEKEGIEPGASYDLTVQLAAGEYDLVCRPDGSKESRTTITVTGRAEVAAQAQAAVDAYRAYVRAQADALVPVVDRFAAAVKAGQVERAKSLYAASRVPWERVEPVAESFGDLDPKVDLREADLESGQRWMGWHRIEKALWRTEDLRGTAVVADRLAADVRELRRRVPTAEMTVASIGNGAKELLDEVATGKITGEEEAFSHTDLVDFQANLDGARKAYDVLRPLVDDPALLATLDAAFTAVQDELDTHRRGSGFVSYDRVGEPQRRELARVVDGLGEPLSRLTAAAV